jgi:hypothetical protein
LDLGMARVSVNRNTSTWRNTRLRCDCSGYWFPHRKTGGACTHGPRSDFYNALRAGLPVSEAMALLSAVQIERMFPV